MATMNANGLRIRRTKYDFTRIETGKAFDELNCLPSIPNHKQLTLRSISEALGDEVSQVKNDIYCVYQAVRNDITFENEQMETVDHQLKKSVRRVNHLYDKVLANRAENQESKFKSNILENLINDVENMSGSFTEVENTIENILTAFSQIDARIPPKSRLLNGHVFNEQHYPLLFGLMRQKFGDQFAASPEEAGFDEIEDIQAPLGETKSSSTSIGSNSSISQVRGSEAINELITRYRFSQAAKTSSPNISDAYLPPSLRKASVPSTKTTFETVSAEQTFKADSTP